MSQLNLILLGWRDPRAATESDPESRAKPAVEAAIDDGIVHGGAHGQPEDRQVDLLDELVAVDVLLEAAQDEVEVVGQPADGKYHHHQHHGLHKLVQERLRSLLSLEALSPNPPKDRVGVSLLPAWEALDKQILSTSMASIPWSICCLDTPRPSTLGLLLSLVPLPLLLFFLSSPQSSKSNSGATTLKGILDPFTQSTSSSWRMDALLFLTCPLRIPYANYGFPGPPLPGICVCHSSSIHR